MATEKAVHFICADDEFIADNRARELFAELSKDDKNAISHRGAAAAKLCRVIFERVSAALETENKE